MPWVLNSLLGLQMLAPLAFPGLWQIGLVGYNYCYLVVISWQGRRDMDNSCVLWLLEVRVLSGFKVLIVGVASVTRGWLSGWHHRSPRITFIFTSWMFPMAAQRLKCCDLKGMREISLSSQNSCRCLQIDILAICNYGFKFVLSLFFLRSWG